jgi:hypothetical protein
MGISGTEWIKKLLVAGLDYLPEWCREYIKSAEITCVPDVSDKNLSQMIRTFD